MNSPLSTDSPLSTLHSPLSTLHSPLSTLNSQLSTPPSTLSRSASDRARACLRSWALSATSTRRRRKRRGREKSEEARRPGDISSETRILLSSPQRALRPVMDRSNRIATAWKGTAKDLTSSQQVLEPRGAAATSEETKDERRDANLRTALRLREPGRSIC